MKSNLLLLLLMSCLLAEKLDFGIKSESWKVKIWNKHSIKPEAHKWELQNLKTRLLYYYYEISWVEWIQFPLISFQALLLFRVLDFVLKEVQ